MTARHACVVGWPARHSRSPIIHGYWLEHFAIAGSYGVVETPPAGFPDFLRTLSQHGYVGCNVTVPHKEAVLGLVHQSGTTARSVGAANTVWYEDNLLFADNTDVGGFLASLDQDAPGWDSTLDSVVVLGAGGAARAIVWGLISRGAGRIHVINRDQDRARKLSSLGHAVEAATWDSAEALLPQARLLVNTTSLGMEGQPGLPLDLSCLSAAAVVCDLVYVPLETELLGKARARGNRVVDGLGMLLHQAVPGFERWFGVRPSVTEELRRLVVADLART